MLPEAIAIRLANGESRDFLLREHGWDPNLHELRVEDPKINLVTVAPDSRLVASTGADITHVVRVWDSETALEIARLDPQYGLMNLLFSPDGEHLAGTGCGTGLIVWHVPTGRQVCARKDLSLHVPWGPMTFSSDGRYLAVGGRDGAILLLQAPSFELAGMLRGHEVSVSALAFAPDDATLASGGFDSTIRLWHVATGRRLDRLHDSTPLQTGPEAADPDLAYGTIWSLSWSADARRLAAYRYDGQVTVWGMPDRTPGPSVRGPVHPFTTVAMAPDGRYLLVCGGGTAALWDLG